MNHRTTLLRAGYYLCAVAVIVAAIARARFSGINPEDILWIAAGIVSLYAGLHIRVHDVRRNAGGASKSMYASTAVLALLFGGFVMAATAALVASIAYDIVRKRPISRMMGNLSTRLTPIGVAAGVWVLLGGGSTLTMPSDYLPLIGCVVVFSLVNEGMFIFDMASGDRRSRDRVRAEVSRFRGNFFETLLEGSVGAGVAVIAVVSPWATPIVLPLALSMYLAIERGNRILEITDRALDTFATVVDERDRYTFEHSERVCDYALMIGEKLGFGERQLEALYWTSRLHDLGKVAVDNAILNKPGVLEDEEFEVMKLHPEVSARILASFSFDPYDIEVVRCHHERYDGRGYLQMHGLEVPVEAYVIAVADAFDAMTSDRPYRKALDLEIALTEIARNIGTQFQPDAAHAFLEVMGWDLEEQLYRATSDQVTASDAPRGANGTVPGIIFGDDIRPAA